MSAILKLTARQGKLLDGIAQPKTPVQDAREARLHGVDGARAPTGSCEGRTCAAKCQTLLRGNW
jgi:hypothetical protein